MYVLPYQWNQGLHDQSCRASCRLRMAIPDQSEPSFASWQVTAVFAKAPALDITQQVLPKLQAERRTVLTAADIGGLFAESPVPKFIKIENAHLADWRPLRIRFGAPFELKLDAQPVTAQTKTRVVYFINCYINKNYIYLFTGQMQELATTGLFENTAATLCVVSSGTAHDKGVLQQELRRIFPAENRIIQEHTEQNLYEYPGIHKVWELGRQDTDGLILYFHARGISRIKLGRFRRNRQPLEKRLFRRVIGEWGRTCCGSWRCHRLKKSAFHKAAMAGSGLISGGHAHRILRISKSLSKRNAGTITKIGSAAMFNPPQAITQTPLIAASALRILSEEIYITLVLIFTQIAARHTSAYRCII